MNPKIPVVLPVADRDACFMQPLPNGRRVRLRYPNADGLMQSLCKAPETSPATV
jgi:hypothetical protein